jgi:hypothetical protein
MIIPEYWAEGRLQDRKAGKQVTLRRFGWSDVSEEDAQKNANARVQEAMQRVLAGEVLRRKDLKVAYNGADGIPIREEILSRHGDTIITRNSYGAKCLNSPSVLFVDIDYQDRPSFKYIVSVFATIIFIGIVLGWATNLRAVWYLTPALALMFSGSISKTLFQRMQDANGGHENAVRERVSKFLAANPSWSFRLYRTPAGMRALATHRTFNPDDPEVAECFAALGADPVYVAMCTNQKCFRARLSAKPWRIGIQQHLRPRPGVWPIAVDKLPMRNRWVTAYDEKAKSFSACKFVESVGSGAVHQDTKSVVNLHDEISGADGNLPIA